MYKFLPFLFLPVLFCDSGLFAQSTSDVIVPVTVTTSKSPASITLSFPATANATSTRIGKKLPNQTAWTYKYLPAATTSWTDTAVTVGIGYEYYVAKLANIAPITRYGLVYAGIELPAVAYRGKVILVVDDALSKPLAAELERLAQDLRGDGWQVIRHDINTAASTVPSVKALLQADYAADPDRTVAVLLFGDIPVPYSGNINPDGHADHQGAWPTDYYYSDLDDDWTDNTVNNTLASRAANRNVPNDGKFDQSQTPSFPEIVVSRVDFSNLTGWDVSQTELYRRYLNKNHAFRTGAYRPDNKTLVDDNFGYFGGEAFAQNGLNNGNALTGPANVVQGDFFTGTETQSYLLGYGCGGGNYTGASGVGSSSDFMTDSVNITFAQLFGSYFGDWDYENNPFMPSALASKGGILTCAWAGRPNWTLHHMGLGEPILLSTFWAWVNSFISPVPYPANFGADLVHVGLLGDPTLRAHAVKPPANMAGKAACTEAQLSWTASADNGILGYAIYRAASLDSAFQFLTVVSDSLHYTDKTAAAGPNFYQIRALRLETTPTGSYFNQSVGAPFSVDLSPKPYQISVVPTAVSCNGGNDGSLDLTLLNGSASFLWSTGATTQDINGLMAGTYSLTITQANGCTETRSYSIQQPLPISRQLAVIPVTCFGLSNGRIDVTVGGGTPGYTLVWSTGKTGQPLNNVPVGTYTVTITDAKGCTVSTSATVTGPADLFIPLTPTPVVCYGTPTGAINASAGGGTPGYSYLWSTGATTAALGNIPAGTYTLTLTDANGCTKTATATVPSPAAMSVQPVSTNITCFGLANGTASLTASGGTPGYSYHWSNGKTTPGITALTPGTYTATVTDQAGCTSTASVTITQPPALTASARWELTDCPNNLGTVRLDVGGGTPGYTFLWPTGATTQNLPNVLPALYTVTITDQAGCTQVATNTITQHLPLVTALNVAPAQCYGQNNGSIDLNVTGGNAPYQYLWSNGAITEDVQNVPAGDYTVTVTDGSGCTTTAIVPVSEPGALVVNQNIVVPTSCFGSSDGLLSVQVDGGTSPYSFLWSTGQKTNPLPGLSSGAYTVTVTDAHGCTQTATAAVASPPAINTQVTTTVAGCAGATNGSVSLLVNGGSPGYTFQWSNGAVTQSLGNVAAGTYTVTITDTKGCTQTAKTVVGLNSTLAVQAVSANINCFGLANGTASVSASGGQPGYSFFWSNGGNTPSLEALPPGSYTATVTDQVGCSLTASVTITQPPALTATARWELTDCPNNLGNVTLDAGGGTPGYAFLWSTGAVTQNLMNVSPALYVVTITDQAGCTHAVTNTITQYLPLVTTSSIVPPACYGQSNGSIDLSVAGGNAPYTYLWSTGAVTPGLQNLPDGTYTVTVTEKNGCTVDRTVVVTEPEALTLTQTIATSITCFGGADGVLGVQATGGTGPYQYVWSNGKTAAAVSGLSSGFYTVTVTDAHGCTSVLPALPLTDPPPVIGYYRPWDMIACPGFATELQIDTIFGGAGGPYQFSLDFDVLLPVSTPAQLTSGLHTISYFDRLGCFTADSIFVDEPAGSGVFVQGNDSVCVDLPETYSLQGNFTTVNWTIDNAGVLVSGQGTGTVAVVWPAPGLDTLSAVVTYGAGCTDTLTFAVFADVCVGTHETALPDVAVRPNPFDTWLELQFDRPVAPGAHWRLSDMQGRLMLENTLSGGNAHVETGDLPAGAYLLQVLENGRLGIWKLVKME